MFGAGTACVVSPVEKILYVDDMLNIPTMSEGAPITMRFYNELTDIQVRYKTVHDFS
jgi:branched-chain amino acid aminotransferase